MSATAPLRLGVTGTDTGVGKTVVTCALLTALRARGIAARGMKPVETGVEVPRAPDTDAARLRRAAGRVDAWEDVCPATYVEPLAPMVAAERAARPLDLPALDAAAARLGASADALLVEGAGGLLVPFTRSLTFAGLATRWGLELIVVAADRLGVLNHALLTVREAERQGLRVRAVVLNAVRPAPADVAEATNAAVLRDLLDGVPLVTMPYLDEVGREDPVRLAAAGRALADLLLH